jgi:hypothetical protein
MIVKDNLEVAQHHDDALGDLYVCSGWHRVAGRMIVRQGHRMGMELQRPSCNLAAVCWGLIEGTVCHTLFMDKTVSAIKEEREKPFL